MIGAARECIGGAKIFPRDVGKAEIKLRNVKEPASLATVEFLGLSEIREVFVVGEYLDWGGGSEEIMSPSV